MKPSPSRPAEKNGPEIVAFLKSFEGAAATFSDEDGTWSLWIPEIVAGERPVTPGSQVFFPVILRHGSQLIAIRFFYDCRTGKVKFYTGAIPAGLSKLPEFEHAVSELFRHSLPVEPIKQRELRRSKSPHPAAVNINPVTRKEQILNSEAENAGLSKPPKPEPETPPAKQVSSLPKQLLSEKPEPSKAKPSLEVALVAPSAPAMPEQTITELVPASESVASTPRETAGVRFEICESTRRVLQVLILVIGILGILGIAAFVYLQISEDPGLKHHRLQLEQQRLRSGG